MATPRAAPTRHRHTDHFSGITNTYLADTSRGGGGTSDGKKIKHKMLRNCNNTLRRTASKQVRI